MPTADFINTKISYRYFSGNYLNFLGQVFFLKRVYERLGISVDWEILPSVYLLFYFI